MSTGNKELDKTLESYKRSFGDPDEHMVEAITIYLSEESRNAYRREYHKFRTLCILNEAQQMKEVKVLRYKKYTLGLTYSEEVRYSSIKNNLKSWHQF